jgi:hypothetical protein
MTFGGWREDWMMVVTQLVESAPHHYEIRTDKFLFALPKHKVGTFHFQLVLTYYIVFEIFFLCISNVFVCVTGTALSYFFFSVLCCS